MQPTTTQVAERLVTFFGTGVNALAWATGFMRRRARKGLDGVVFLRSMVLGFLEEPMASLPQLVQGCVEQGVDISVPALDQRIGAGSVAFLQALFQRALAWLQNQEALALPVLQHFSAVNLVDSSVVSLPAGMATAYPGAGGKASPASLKVQVVLEFLRGNFTHVALTSGRQPDQSYQDYLAAVAPRSLTLWDLGYFNLDALAAIIARPAYWLSRYLYPTAVFTATGERLDLLTYLRHLSVTQQELAIRLGARPQHHLPCRLLIYRVPDAVAEHRRRQARAKAKRQGHTLSPDTLFLYGWTLLVTNVPPEWLTLHDALALYHLRWQVELCFKFLKSYCGLAHVTGFRRERVLTDIYAKLIAAVVLNSLLAPLRMPDAEDPRREVSAFQVARIVRHWVHTLGAALGAQEDCAAVVAMLQHDFLRHGLKSKRCRHPNVGHMLAELCATAVNATDDQVPAYDRQL